MDVQTHDKTIIRTTATLAQWTTVIGLCCVAMSAYGQTPPATPGEAFNEILNSQCTQANVLPSLVPLCVEYASDDGRPDAGADVGGQNNLGTLGGQNQTAGRADKSGPIFQAPTWSVFGSVNIGNRQRSTTRLEDGYEGDVIGAAMGVDKSISDKLVAGIVLGQFQFDADFDLGVGSMETETRSAALFLTYNHSDTSTASLYFGRDSIDLENVRNINVVSGTKQASSNTEGSQNVAGINVYFHWPLDAWVVGADLSIDYVDAKIDGFDETSTLGNTTYLLSYPDQDIESLTLSTGIEVAYNASMSWGVLVPRLRLAYMRETENEAREVKSSFAVLTDSDKEAVSFIVTTDAADKNFFAASLGASAVLTGDWQLFLDATTFTGNSLLSSWVINVGINKSF
ncbi:MAG: autotransporter outer membrane beta-barrel domain-containing protein [Gammaproteobacteria bacterium]|nr:autotransporter outer membrane beta-barrel domain-containing protein [Gammaproteobacteria bacterium]